MTTEECTCETGVCECADMVEGVADAVTSGCVDFDQVQPASLAAKVAVRMGVFSGVGNQKGSR